MAQGMTTLADELKQAILRRYDAFDADLFANADWTLDERQAAWRALLDALQAPLAALQDTTGMDAMRRQLNRLLALEGKRMCKDCGRIKALACYHIYQVGGRLYYRPECARCVIARVAVDDAERQRAFRRRQKRRQFAETLGVTP